MNKHLLVTISDDTTAQWALKFVCAFFRNKHDVHLTLFYTAPQPPTLWAEEKNFETVSANSASAAAIIADGRKAMDFARGIFLSGGFAPSQVDDKIISRNLSRIGDIIREGERGLYDAVVFGRRALVRLQDFLDTRATEEMLKAEFAFPVWICRDVEYARRGVLLCVDDSEAFRRIADHAGFILKGEAEHEVTLLRVAKKDESQDATDRMFEAAARALTENDFPADRIRTRRVVADDVAGTILREAERGRFAAVAVGRPVRQRGALAKMFSASVPMALLRRLSGAALWVSR